MSSKTAAENRPDGSGSQDGWAVWVAGLPKVADGPAVLKRTGHKLMLAMPRDGEDCLVKLWNLCSAKNTLRRLTRTTKARNEWRALNHLWSRGFNVPEPRAYVVLDHGETGYHEAIVMRHIGETQRVSEYLVNLLTADIEGDVWRVSEEVTQYTKQLIAHGIVDSDNRIGNYLITANGDLFRVDFESAERFHALRFQHKLKMVASLMSSYLWATRRCPELADRAVPYMIATLGLSRKEERVVKRLTRAALEGRLQHTQAMIDIFRGW